MVKLPEKLEIQQPQEKYISFWNGVGRFLKLTGQAIAAFFLFHTLHDAREATNEAHTEKQRYTDKIEQVDSVNAGDWQAIVQQTVFSVIDQKKPGLCWYIPYEVTDENGNHCVRVVRVNDSIKPPAITLSEITFSADASTERIVNPEIEVPVGYVLTPAPTPLIAETKTEKSKSPRNSQKEEKGRFSKAHIAETTTNSVRTR